MNFLFLLIGSISFFCVIFGSLKSISAAKWPSVDGELLSIDFKQKQDEYGFCQEPVITYTYQVGANICTSTRYGFGFMTRATHFENIDEVERIVWQEPLVVYYHPRKPKLSVLQTGIRMTHIVHGLISVSIIVIGQLLFA